MVATLTGMLIQINEANIALTDKKRNPLRNECMENLIM
jgi:hypothetical protein